MFRFQILLRKLFNVGITASTGFVQHFTLAVGVLGGALAARQDRLLSLSTLTAFLPERWKNWTQLLSGAFAMGITAVLAWASWKFVMTLKPDSPELAYGVRIWMFQLLLPVGFAAIVLRLCWHVSCLCLPGKRLGERLTIRFQSSSGLLSSGLGSYSCRRHYSIFQILYWQLQGGRHAAGAGCC